MENPHQLALFFGAALLFALVSKVLTRKWLTAPMVFVAFGLLTGAGGLGWLTFQPDSEWIKLLTEVTLMLVLFADASQIRVSALRHRVALPARLLGISMPLTIAAGTAVAMLLMPDWSVWEAALVATVLAPTDAALGQAVVSNEAVPGPIREALTVESGLNDGIALPVVLVFLALATTEVGDGSGWLWFWAGQVILGPIAGLAIGSLSGWSLDRARSVGWTSPAALTVGGLATVALCYLGAEAIGGNGFMATFVGGMAFGARASHVEGQVHEFLESEGQLLMWMVFTVLGCLYALPALVAAEPMHWLYALLSLTVIRGIPTAISLIGTKLPWQTVGFLGWFGPRGLASILFGLLLVEEVELTTGDALFQVVVLTVILSVVLHGLTAAWAASGYGKWAEGQAPPQA